MNENLLLNVITLNKYEYLSRKEQKLINWL